MVESSKGRDTFLANHCMAVSITGDVSQKVASGALNGYNLANQLWKLACFSGFSHSSSINLRISTRKGKEASCYFKIGKDLITFFGG